MGGLEKKKVSRRDVRGAWVVEDGGNGAWGQCPSPVLAPHGKRNGSTRGEAAVSGDPRIDEDGSARPMVKSGEEPWNGL